jgi:1-acyl-sn-glycerol-3-phosphate acyltransferase
MLSIKANKPLISGETVPSTLFQILFPNRMIGVIFGLLFRMVLNVFFREIKVRGYHNIPKDGPVLFAVAPHSNQFVDPLLLINTCGRKVGFLAVNMI